MSIGLTNALDGNANFENEHASASATAASDGSVHHSDDGVTYDGSAGGDVAYSADLPDTPDVDAAASATGALDATVDDVHARADATLEAAGGAPELPELDGGVEGALGGDVTGSVSEDSVGVDGVFSGMLDAMGDLMASVSASVSAILGL